jgi:mannose-6-phosphate isomerase-like protein (cupin superfamily)
VDGFQTTSVPEEFETAPDGSEIRPLLKTVGGSFAHCNLPAGYTSLAVRHRTVEEIWFFISGKGEMWRKQGDREELVEVGPSVCLTIPLGTHFQFRNIGEEPLCSLIATMPPWPGNQEAVRVEGRWSSPP